MKKNHLRIQENSKQRANSGSSIQSNENLNTKKRPSRIDLVKEQEQHKLKSISDDEQSQRHIYRVPPLKIVLARAVLQKTPDIER